MFNPRYPELSKKIAKDIKSGRWQDRLPPVKELTNIYGANASPILKALRILENDNLITVIKGRGTFINEQSQKETYRQICIVDTPYSEGSPILHDLHAMAASYGYSLMFVQLDEKRLNQINILKQMPVDGFVVRCIGISDNLAIQLRKENIPFVLAFSYARFNWANWIGDDFEKAIREAYEHLFSLGHTNIAYVAFKFPLEAHEEMAFSEYKTFMSKVGIFDKSNYFAEHDSASFYRKHGEDYHKANGILAAKRMLQKKEDMPTAAIVQGLPMADAFAAELQKNGIRVPEDFSIIVRTVNDPAEDDFYTLIHAPWQARVTGATRILLDLLTKTANPPVQQLLAEKLIVKKSTERIHSLELETSTK